MKKHDFTSYADPIGQKIGRYIKFPVYPMPLSSL